MSDTSNIRQNSPLTSEEQPITKIKLNRKKRSWTWDYFEDVEQTNDKGELLKRCKVLDIQGNKCGTLYVNDGSTGNAINHLLTDHELSKDGKTNNVCIFFFDFIVKKL